MQIKTYSLAELKKLLKRSGYKYPDLASTLGIDPTSVGYKMNRDSRLTIADTINLLSLIDCNLAIIINNEKDGI